MHPPPVAAICGSLSQVAHFFTHSASTLVIGVSVLVGAITAPKASAVIVINAIESGSDVTFSFSGSITDLNNFLELSPVTFEPGFFANGGFLIGPGDEVDQYVGDISGPTVVGPGTDLVAANSNFGDTFGFFFGAAIFPPQGYTPGTIISGTSIYNSATLNSLGITPGTYVWTLGNTAADTITLNASATPVPLESDALPIMGSALFMAGGLWWKRKRAQAKATEFIAKQ